MNFFLGDRGLRNLFPMVAVAFSQLLVVAYTICGPRRRIRSSREARPP